MNTTIYYFTGTGNSLKIARDLKDEFGNTEIVQICKNNLGILSNTVSDKIGFVFPVYFGGLPQMVEKFIQNLNINKNAYIFAVANYGGSVAIAFEQIEKLLNEKGIKLSAVYEIPMPGNMWFMYYPHPKQDIIDRVNAQKQVTLEVAEMIKNNTLIKVNAAQDSEQKWKNYESVNPSIKDVDFWTNINCTGCGLCYKICPARNIKIVDKKPVWQHNCEFCLACIHWCPQNSIQYKNDSLNGERYHNPAIKVQELYQD